MLNIDDLFIGRPFRLGDHGICVTVGISSSNSALGISWKWGLSVGYAWSIQASGRKAVGTAKATQLDRRGVENLRCYRPAIMGLLVGIPQRNDSSGEMCQPTRSAIFRADRCLVMPAFGATRTSRDVCNPVAIWW